MRKYENWLSRLVFWYKQVVLEVDYGLPYFMLVILSQFLFYKRNRCRIVVGELFYTKLVL